MAVIALGFAGQALGGAIGGSILGVSSAAIGGFLGQAVGGLLDNMLFGGTKVQGPRLEDKRVQVSTYGSTLPVIYGPENRIAGLVIWSTGLLETAKKTKQGGKGGPSVTTTSYTYRVSFALALADRKCQGVKKIWANQKLIYDRDGTGSPPVTDTLFAAMRFYPGDGLQMPDPTLESYLGAGNAPAYRHTSYLVIEDLQLADFGNRLPNLEVLLEADTAITLPSVLADLCVRCGVDINEVATTGLRSETVRGYAITGASRGTDAIQPLALAYSFDAAEQGGNLRFVSRGLGVRGVIPLADMGAYQGFDAEVPEPIRFDLMPTFGLPKEAVVTFSDPSRDYQRSSQPARRQFGDAESNLSYDLPVVVTNDEGRRIADRMLYEAWTGRRAAAWTVNDRWRSARPGDSYFVEGPAGLTRVRLTRALRGANGLIQMESREDDPVIYQSDALGVPGAIPEQVIGGIPVVDIVFLDIPLLLDADQPTGEGFYFGLEATGPGWRGANLLRAVEADGSYSEVTSQGTELTVGEVALGNLIALPGGFDTATDWDETSVIRVRGRYGKNIALDAASDAEVLAGANAAYVGPASGLGGEIIQFANAVLNTDGTYTLTRLRRAQRGTDAEARLAHGLGQMFVLLEPGALLRVNFGFGDLGRQRWFKAVPLLGTPDDAPVETFTNTGIGLRPYAPVMLTAARTLPSNDIALGWTRRSRVGGDLVPPPLAEDTELYTVEILHALGAVVLRSVEVTSPEWTYTEADQVADFGSPLPAVLNWRVAQVSTVFGNGTFATRNAAV